MPGELIMSWLREHTLCRLGIHCRAGKRITKYDDGRLPQLCCYCYTITEGKGFSQNEQEN
jgi:hypothetical protein